MRQISGCLKLAAIFAAYDECKNMIAAISGFDNFGPAEIGGLWVHEKYRRRGYGKALLDHAEKWATEKGCKAMRVFTIKIWPACVGQIWFFDSSFLQTK